MSFHRIDALIVVGLSLFGAAALIATRDFLTKQQGLLSRAENAVLMISFQVTQWSFFLWAATFALADPGTYGQVFIAARWWFGLAFVVGIIFILCRGGTWGAGGDHRSP